MGWQMLGIDWNGCEKNAVSHASWTLNWTLIAVGFIQTEVDRKWLRFKTYFHEIWGIPSH